MFPAYITRGDKDHCAIEQYLFLDGMFYFICVTKTIQIICYLNIRAYSKDVSRSQKDENYTTVVGEISDIKYDYTN